MENTAKPLIYQSEGTKNSNLPSFSKNFFQKNIAKIIFGLLGLVILFELVIGINSALKKPSVQIAKVQPLGSGKIIISSPKNIYKAGETVPVEVRVATGGRSTVSTDLVLHYDPNLLETSQASIKVGKIYEDFPIADVDSENGLIRISGISPPGEEGFSGIGSLAAINFTAKAEGSAELSVDFTSGQTTDSNIVDSASPKDILSEVVNQKIQISNAQISTNTDSQSAKCAGFLQYCQDSKGRSGSQFCYEGAIMDGVCVFDPKLSTKCNSCKVK